MSKADLNLAVVRENLEFLLSRFEKVPWPDFPTPSFADLVSTAWVMKRRLGISLMLTETDRNGFLDQLHQSGELRFRFLAWSRGHEAKEGFGRFVTGTRHRLGPFFDSIASGDWTLATRLADTTTASFDGRYEYGDDYAYAEVLFELARVNFSVSSTISEPMQRFVRAVQAGPSARLEACRALVSGSAADFDEALGQLVTEHREEFREKGSGTLADPDGFATERFVLVEGLALKMVATRLGIEVLEEHPLMPRDAFLAVDRD